VKVIDYTASEEDFDLLREGMTALEGLVSLNGERAEIAVNAKLQTISRLIDIEPFGGAEIKGVEFGSDGDRQIAVTCAGPVGVEFRLGRQNYFLRYKAKS